MKWVFWISAAVLAYTYFGYPVLLWLRVRWRPRPVQPGFHQPLVSVVMVVRNEAPLLQAKVQALLELDYPPDRCELVVVSDGSTDGSDELLREQARNLRVQVVLNQFGRGKASGLNDALEFAQGEILVFTDVRQRIEREALRRLIENFTDPGVGCVSGALMLGDPEAGESARGLGAYWSIERKIRELESRSGSVVGATGALYAVRRELLAPLPPETILDDVYIPMQVVRQGRRVILEPQARTWDQPDLGAGKEFARKVRTLSGNYQLLQLAPWLMRRENPIRFEFVSHKLLRLAAPFALAAMLVSSAYLPGTIYRATLAAQLAFYALSLLAMVRLKHGPLARAADAAWTFVLLNTAAMVAFARFVTGRKVVWSR